MSKLLFRVIILSAVVSIFALSQSATAAVGDGLIAVWPMDENTGTTTADEVDGINDGSLLAGQGGGIVPAWVPGKFGSALDFDGVSAYVDCGSDASLKPATVSVSAWVKFDDYPYYGQVAGFAWDTGAEESGYSLICDDYYVNGIGDSISAWVSGGSVVDGSYFSASAIPAVGSWHHIALTYDGTTSTIYVDGVSSGTMGTESGDLNYTYPIAPVVNTFKMGVYQAGTWWLPYEGLIDDVAVWDRALVQADIDALYAGGTGVPAANFIIRPNPNKPTPKNGAIQIPLNTGVSCSPPNTYTPVYYDVRFGTDPNEMDLKLSKQALLSWTPSSDLDLATTYYWQVNPYEPNIPGDGSLVIKTPGPIWSFTTLRLITAEPDDVLIAAGGTAEFTVEGIGLTGWQWYRSDDPNTNTPADDTTLTDAGIFSGATTGTLTLTGVGFPDEGYYFCYVYNATEDVNDLTIAAGLIIEDLVGWWKLDDASGTIATDTTTYANNGTVTGGATWTSGRDGGALSFDGVDDYVACVAGTGPRPTTAITIAAWVKPDRYGYYEGIAGMLHDTGSTEAGYLLTTGTGGTFGGGVTGNGGISYIFDGGGNSTAQWYHVALTNDGSTTRLYVNGEEKDSVAKSTPIDYDPGPDTFEIGRFNDDNEDHYFMGTIDDVRVYNYALTPGELTDLVGMVITTSPQDTTVDPGTEAILTCTAVNATTYEWYKDDASTPLSDAGKYSNTTTASLTIADVQVGEEGMYYCVVDNPTEDPLASAKARVLTKRLWAHWALDGNADDTSISIDKVHGAVVTRDVRSLGAAVAGTAGFTWVTGVNGIGQAINLVQDHATDPNHIHDYIVIVDDANDLELRSDDFTISAWVKGTDFEAPSHGNASAYDPAVVSNKDWDSGGNSGWVIDVDTNSGYDSAEWNIGDGSNRSDIDLATPALNDDQWHMMTVTHDRDGNATLYVDGLVQASTSMAAIGNVDTNYPIAIGTDGAEGTVWPSWFRGTIDDVRLYSYALSREQVADDYAEYYTTWSTCFETPRFDTNDDCIINLTDFAAFAEMMMDCNLYPAGDC